VARYARVRLMLPPAQPLTPAPSPQSRFGAKEAEVIAKLDAKLAPMVELLRRSAHRDPTTDLRNAREVMAKVQAAEFSGGRGPVTFAVVDMDMFFAACEEREDPTLKVRVVVLLLMCCCCWCWC